MTNSLRDQLHEEIGQVLEQFDVDVSGIHDELTQAVMYKVHEFLLCEDLGSGEVDDDDPEAYV